MERLRLLIDRLEALIRHPSTPENEASSARLRIVEIREKIRRMEHDVSVRPRSVRVPKKVAVRDIRNRRPKKNVRPFPIYWPFGYVERGAVDLEVVAFGKEIVIGWACPSCGRHVERCIDAKHNLRLRGQQGGVEGFIELLRIGSVNQLCDDCIDRFN